MVKNPPAMQEIWVRSLSQEDPLEKEIATHFSILAWRISWTGEPGGLQSMGLQRIGHDRATNNLAFTYFENAVALDLLLQLLYIFIFKSKYYHRH